MLKRWFLVGGILLLVSLLLIGCGVPKEDYDAVVAERDSTQAELESVRAKVSELTSNLEESETEIEAVKAELEEIKTDNDALEQANDKLKRLTFYVTALCSKEPSPAHYTAKPDNTFTTDESVYVYCQVTGFKHRLVDHKLETDIGYLVKIVNEEGEEVRTWGKDDSQRIEEPWAFYWLWYEAEDLEAGNYTAEVEFTDNISGETATWKEEFQVVSR